MRKYRCTGLRSTCAPSTVTTSRSDTSSPSEAALPFTLTRPSPINLSQARLLAMPHSARYLLILIPSVPLRNFSQYIENVFVYCFYTNDFQRKKQLICKKNL